MIYLLDTNACVGHLRSAGQSSISDRLRGLAPGDVTICSVVKAELVYGAYRSRNAQKNLAQVRQFFGGFLSLPFDDRAADAYGVVRSQLDTQGNTIGPNDLMIAAIAVSNGLTLVTHNTAEFGRITGLKIEDWE